MSVELSATVGYLGTPFNILPAPGGVLSSAVFVWLARIWDAVRGAHSLHHPTTHTLGVGGGMCVISLLREHMQREHTPNKVTRGHSDVVIPM